jgi:hypothetical protein
MVLPLFVETISIWIPFLAIALSLEIEEKQPLRCFYTKTLDFGSVTKGYPKGNLNNGHNPQATSLYWIRNN